MRFIEAVATQKLLLWLLNLRRKPMLNYEDIDKNYYFDFTQQVQDEEESLLVGNLFENSENPEHQEIYNDLRTKPEIKEVLIDLVEELPLEERIILHKKFWLEMDEAEIACEMGYMTKTVFKKIEESYDFLRERLISEFYNMESLAA